MDGTNAYIYTTGTAPAEQVNLSTGTITYLVADLLGSVRGTVGTAGALTATAAYDAWGNPLAPGGLTAATPFGFAGGYSDPTGLVYLQHRYYDAQAGQFPSLDPLLSTTLQPYAYADDNPVSQTDPTGAFEENPANCYMQAQGVHLRKSGGYNTVGYKTLIKCAIPVREIEVISQMCKLEWGGLICKYQGEPEVATNRNESSLLQKNLAVDCVNNKETSWTCHSHGQYRYGNKWYPGDAAPTPQPLACGTPG
jgi:RHS repeat-associated protein